MKVTTVTRFAFGFGVAAGLMVGFGTSPAMAQPAPTYSVTNLGTLGGDSFALDINLRGQIVGTYLATDSNEPQAFLYSGGGMAALGTLGGAYSYAYAINQVGDIAGDSATGLGLQHAYLWRGGAMTDLGTLGGGRSQSNGVNTRRQVVGWVYPDSGTQHAFLFENGVMTDIGSSFRGGSIATDIDEFGRVVGYYDASGGSRPFRWVAGVISDLGTLGGANKINLFGEVAGWSSDIDDKLRPVIFRGGAIVDLGNVGCMHGPLGAFANEAEAQAGAALTEEQARLLAAAAEGLRATQDYR